MAATPNGTSTAAGSTSTSVAPATPSGSVAGDVLCCRLYVELNSPAVLSFQNALINVGGGIDAAQTTGIAYDNGSNLPTAGEIQIDSEVIQYTGGGGAASGTLTGVTRGAYGTTGATHADNARMSSWIRVLDSLQAGPASFDYREIIFWKHVGASEPVTQVFTFSNAYREASIQRVTGAPVTGNVIDVVLATINGSQNTVPTANAITTTIADELVLVFFETADGGGAQWSNASCLLNGAIDNSQTSGIAYDGGTSPNFIPAAGDIVIDGEVITYTGGGGAASGTLTGVTRGANGTTPAAHSDNAAITSLLTQRIASVSMAEYSFVKATAGTTGTKYVHITGGANPEWHVGAQVAIKSASALVKKADETVQLAEGKVRTRTMVRVKGETENLPETNVRSRLMSRVRTETENVSEGTVRTRLMARVRGETVNVAEGTVRIVATLLVKAVSETVQVIEGAVRHRSMARVRSETVNLAETIGRAIRLVRTRNESEAINETRLGQRQMVRLRNETVNLGEGSVKLVAAFLVKVVADIVNIVEGRVRTISLRRIRSETENVSEATGRTRSMVRVIAETERLQEATLRTRLMVRLRNEVTNIVEGVTKLLGAVVASPYTIDMDAEYEPKLALEAEYEPKFSLDAEYEQG